MLAGSIDSYRDPVILAHLDAAQRLKSAGNMDGCVPGEGAGFLLLTRASTAAAHSVAALASVSPVAAGFETGHLESAEPYRGDGLAAVFRQLTAGGAVQAPVGEVYSSMNGENHWAKEWGVAYLRNKALFQERHGMHHPADSFGDTGAACGPLFVGLAALGIKHGYRRAPVLVYGSSDAGPRSALVVGAAH
jgi:3-oxoacyl-[acyl-carrier-protein] synthase-1